MDGYLLLLRYNVTDINQHISTDIHTIVIIADKSYTFMRDFNHLRVENVFMITTPAVTSNTDLFLRYSSRRGVSTFHSCIKLLQISFLFPSIISVTSYKGIFSCVRKNRFAFQVTSFTLHHFIKVTVAPCNHNKH